MNLENIPKNHISIGTAMTDKGNFVSMWIQDENGIEHVYYADHKEVAKAILNTPSLIVKK